VAFKQQNDTYLQHRRWPNGRTISMSKAPIKHMLEANPRKPKGVRDDPLQYENACRFLDSNLLGQ
jgi:hypothetical protein